MQDFIIECCIRLQDLKKRDPDEEYSGHTQQALRNLIMKYGGK